MNKGALRTHFKAVLNRSDITNDLADTFIDQSITRIQRVLRVPANEKQASYPISAATTKITVPGDFLEIINIYYDNHVMKRLGMAEIQDRIKSGESGSPHFYCREGASYLLFPMPSSGTVYLNYYCSFTEMSSDSDENTLAKIASDAIIYGALIFASDYFLDERAQLFNQKYNEFLIEITEQSNDAELAGELAMRPSTFYDAE